jgi:uncharacterized protein (DUF433 family)
MSLAIQPASVPLLEDADGVVRVSGTRVTLDTIVQAFSQGATAETISEQYPSVPLAHVYAVIAFYLTHREQVEEYLASRQAQADNVRRMNEARLPDGLRERLLARKKGGH